MPNKLNSNKGFTSTILVLFILVFAGVAGYLYLGKNLSQVSLPTPKSLVTPTPVKTFDPTANWKTYTNTKHNYSIQYPEELFLLDNSDSGQNLSQKEMSALDNVRFSSLKKENNFSGLVLEINVTEGSNKTGTQKCTSGSKCIDYWETIINNPKSIVIYAVILNKKMKGIEYIDNSSRLTLQRHFVFSEKGKTWTVNLSYADYKEEEKDKIDKIFNQILSTFKFLP